MIHVRLDQFEGPLGLLLYLIRKEEMDINDIQIHRITSQYLEYLKRMRELDLELAGEFVQMAATLLLIKSKMLLPQYDEHGELIENPEDPRKELVQRLVEYQMYQEASKQLNDRPLLGRDVFARGSKEEIPVSEGDIIVDEGGLFALISAYRKIMKQVHKNVHQVRAKGQSIAARILEIKDRLIPGIRIRLKDLISPLEQSSNKVLITFLSLLELTKMGFTTLFQAETYGDIYVDTKKPVERNVIERVEEYDRRPEQTEAVAAALEAEAGGRNLQGLGEESEESAQPQVGEQLGLNSIENLVHVEDAASDAEILAAEAEMGFVEDVVDMDKVDQVLANFSLERPQESQQEAQQDMPSIQENVVFHSSESVSFAEGSGEEESFASDTAILESKLSTEIVDFSNISEGEFDIAWKEMKADEALQIPLPSELQVEAPLEDSAEALVSVDGPPEFATSQSTEDERVESPDVLAGEPALSGVEILEDEVEEFVVRKKPELEV